MADHRNGGSGWKSFLGSMLLGALIVAGLMASGLGAPEPYLSEQYVRPDRPVTDTQFTGRRGDELLADRPSVVRNWIDHSDPAAALGSNLVHPEEAFRRNVATYFSSLQSSEVRFNRLESVPFGEPETIKVEIAPPGVEADPTAFIGHEGEIEKHKVPLATQIEAELVSLDDGVEIRPQGPVSILLRPDRSVEHSWRITARRTEPFILKLVLSNHVAIEGRELVDSRPFIRQFEVKVSGWRQALIWMDGLDPIWKLLGGIASLAALVAAAYQAARYLRRHTRVPDEGSPPAG